MPKCPAPGCPATNFQITPVAGVNLLVCGEGHVISRDYSSELQAMARTLSAAIDGVNTTVVAHLEPVKKGIKEIKEAITALSLKD